MGFDVQPVEDDPERLNPRRIEFFLGPLEGLSRRLAAQTTKSLHPRTAQHLGVGDGQDRRRIDEDIIERRLELGDKLAHLFRAQQFRGLGGTGPALMRNRFGATVDLMRSFKSPVPVR